MPRCSDNDLEVIMALKGSTPYGYSTRLAREIVEQDDHFIGVWERLARGDTIRVVYDTGDDLSVVEYIVLDSSREGVKLKAFNDSVMLAPRAALQSSSVTGIGLTKKHVGFGKFEIYDDQDNLLVIVNGKEYAQDIVDEREAVPDQSDIDREARTAAA